MRTPELLKKFSANNINLIKHGTKHDDYYSPITGKIVRVPRHKTELKAGTLHSILTDAGLK